MLEKLLTLAIGAIFGGGVTFLIAQRKLRTENVTVERAKWREKIRQNEADVFAGGHTNAWVTLSANTSPFDDEDLALVRLVRKMTGEVPTEWDADELAARYALLLKHDWDRAKRETSWWPFTLEDFPFSRQPVKRRSYTRPIYRLDD